MTSGYRRFVERAARFPQGAVPSDLLYRILGLLFDEDDAALLARLPLRPFTAVSAARAWKESPSEAERRLECFAGRGLLLDGEHRGRRVYVLPPPMTGFFEFSLMRVRGDLDQPLLARLLHQYINVEDEFVLALFGTETPMARALVCEPALARAGLPKGARADGPGSDCLEGDGRTAESETVDGTLQVLDHELATEIVRRADRVAVGLCFCRHKMAHAGNACDAPQEICLSLDFAADSLARHGHARLVEPAEAAALIEQAWDLGLVQVAENVRRHPKFICNCCSCCCDFLLAARRFTLLHPVASSGFLPVVDPARCTACGRCVAACPVAAVEITAGRWAADDGRTTAALQADAQSAAGAGRLPGVGGGAAAGMREDSGDLAGAPVSSQVAVISERCLGCGLCVRACPSSALRLQRSPEQVVTPVSTAHRIVVQAIERGTLPDLVFDQREVAAHRALAAVLGAVLRLPPLQQALASRQLKSRYLERLLDRPRWRY